MWQSLIDALRELITALAAFLAGKADARKDAALKQAKNDADALRRIAAVPDLTGMSDDEVRAELEARKQRGLRYVLAKRGVRDE